MLKVERNTKNLVQRVRASREVRRALSQPDPPILIYQMGKVGSSTVRASLRTAGLANRTLSVHFLSEAVLRSREHHQSMGLYPYHLAVGTALRHRLRHLTADGCRIISLVRDPIAREFSNLFQNPDLLQIREVLGPGPSSHHVPETLELVRSRLENVGTYQYFFTWFDTELKATFGIDVLSRVFDKDRGWSTYSRGAVQLVMLRLEDLSQAGGLAISEFLGLPSPIELVDSNVRTDKNGASAYRWIRDNLHLDRSACESIYRHRTVSHFYSEQSISAFIHRWT